MGQFGVNFPAKWDMLIDEIEKLILSQPPVITDREISEKAILAGKLSVYVERVTNGLFTYITGSTLLQYINERRMTYIFQRFLNKEKWSSNTERDISCVGETQYIANFKKVYGLTPKQVFILRKDPKVKMLVKPALYFSQLANDQQTEATTFVCEEQQETMYGIKKSDYNRVILIENLTSHFGFNDFEKTFAYTLATENSLSLEDSFQYIYDYIWESIDNANARRMPNISEGRDTNVEVELNNKEVIYLYFNCDLSFDDITRLFEVKKDRIICNLWAEAGEQYQYIYAQDSYPMDLLKNIPDDLRNLERQACLNILDSLKKYEYDECECNDIEDYEEPYEEYDPTEYYEGSSYDKEQFYDEYDTDDYEYQQDSYQESDFDDYIAEHNEDSLFALEMHNLDDEEVYGKYEALVIKHPKWFRNPSPKKLSHGFRLRRGLIASTMNCKEETLDEIAEYKANEPKRGAEEERIQAEYEAERYKYRFLRGAQKNYCLFCKNMKKLEKENEKIEEYNLIKIDRFINDNYQKGTFINHKDYGICQITSVDKNILFLKDSGGKDIVIDARICIQKKIINVDKALGLKKKISLYSLKSRFSMFETYFFIYKGYRFNPDIPMEISSIVTLENRATLHNLLSSQAEPLEYELFGVDSLLKFVEMVGIGDNSTEEDIEHIATEIIKEIVLREE